VQKIRTETDNLFWLDGNSIQADPEGQHFIPISNVLWEKEDFTLEEGMLRRILTDLKERILIFFCKLGVCYRKMDFLEFNSYTVLVIKILQQERNWEYVPKDQLLQNGQPISRKMFYQIVDK